MNRLNCSLHARITTIAALCLSAGLARGASVKIAAPLDATGAPGATVTVPINIRGAQGMGSLQLELTYLPDVLEVMAAAADADMPAVLLEHNAVAPGRVRIALAGNQPVNGDGRINVTFRIKSAGASDLRLENARAWDLDGGLDMLVTTENGRFTSQSGSNLLPWIAGAAATVAVLALIIFSGRRKRPA